MLLEVGRITKPHGLRGEVIVHLVTDRTERVAAGSVLTGDDGRSFEVLASTPHQGNWIVAFAGIEDRTGAEAVRGTVLHAESLDDPDALWVHELIGSEAVDTAGHRLGTVAAIEANPASDLLVLDTGGLVPMRFLVDRVPGRVTVDPPHGLLEEVEE